MVGSIDAGNDSDAGDSPAALSSSSSSSATVSCSICLDLVNDNGERSTAKLQCGHEFHLDCIGSAFNMKGAMQCPNCRKVERGTWLFANGSVRTISDIGGEDWMPTDEPPEFGYSGMPFGVHWCPFGGLTVRSLEEVLSSSNTLAHLQGNHGLPAEHNGAPSLAHSYIAYFRPIPPVSLSFTENTDDSNLGHRWNAQPGQSEIYAPRTSTNIHFQNWACHFPPFSASRGHFDRGNHAAVHPAALRPPIRGESDLMARSGSFGHPFHHIQSQSNPRLQERLQVSYTSHHQQLPADFMGIPSSSVTPGFRRFGVSRGLPFIVPAVSQTDRTGGFYMVPPPDSRAMPEAESQSWGSFHHATRGSDSYNRPGSFCPTHWS